MKPGRFPRLEGWLTLPEAGIKLKMSRQRIHQMVDDGQFTTVHEIGNFIIVREAEVERMRVSRREDAAGEEGR